MVEVLVSTKIEWKWEWIRTQNNANANVAPYVLDVKLGNIRKQLYKVIICQRRVYSMFLLSKKKKKNLLLQV